MYGALLNLMGGRRELEDVSVGFGPGSASRPAAGNNLKGTSRLHYLQQYRQGSYCHFSNDSVAATVAMKSSVNKLEV
jgi:hypothetical protein